MLTDKTFIIVKNIPLDVINILLMDVQLQEKILNQNEEIIVNMKNSRLYIITFNFEIKEISFDLLIKEISNYNKNRISLPHIIGIYKEKVHYIKSDKPLLKNTALEILKIYNLHNCTLHLMLKINNQTFNIKRWFEFWK